MRIALRAKISQKDYVDKDMKHFHYGKEKISNGVLAHPSGIPVNTTAINAGGVQGGNVATQIAAA